jgi:DNA-binding NtrC family response regulator
VRRQTVLIVDDDAMVRQALHALLREYYDTVEAEDAAAALEVVKKRPVDMVLMDVSLPGMDGIKALERIRELDKDMGVVMLSGRDSASLAVSAIKKGAYDYITKPFDNEDLLSTLGRCADRLRLKNEVEFLKGELTYVSGRGTIVSRSPSMKRVIELIGQVARTSSNVLITGESGTGKELAARAIHSMGPRRDKPFVAVNCGAVPSELMESELFGHEKGAFTGAHARKIGKFEYADGGTVFLDEVSTLPTHLQIKLLRVLQERSFERVGGNVPVNVDIRVIAATNVDLEEAVRAGTFREDLYYRLKVVPVVLPPLRERKEDMEPLARHFMEAHGRKCGKEIKGISDSALGALARYPWPGNVRELENLVEWLVVVAKNGSVIGCDDLPPALSNRHGETSNAKKPRDLKAACRSFERDYILGVLERSGWSRKEAARRMKIHRNTLLLKMKALGIKMPRQRPA